MTQEESWVHHYDVETKTKSKRWGVRGGGIQDSTVDRKSHVNRSTERSHSLGVAVMLI